MSTPSPASSVNELDVALSYSSSSNNTEGNSAYLTDLFASVVKNVSNSLQLPEGDDMNYFSSHSDSNNAQQFSQQLSKVKGQVVELLSSLSAAVAQPDLPAHQTNDNTEKMYDEYGNEITHKVQQQQRKLPRLSLSSAASVTQFNKLDDIEKFHTLVDTVDTALERVDTALDQFKKGVTKKDVPKTDKKTNVKETASSQPNNQHSSFLSKPQKFFTPPVDNFSVPFVPLLKEKPHAKKPLPDYQKLEKERKEKEAKESQKKEKNSQAKKKSAVDAHLDSLLADSASAASSSASSSSSSTASSSFSFDAPLVSSYPHPYEYEIDTIVYPEHELQSCKEQLYGSLQQTPCHFISTKEDLHGKLLKHLSHNPSIKEIAIDLEHHSQRSYQGFTCLMQLSTRFMDFLIDTIALRSELHVLNQFFADETIVKVLHGADMDIQWLQKDFGLYIVNLFDTGQCARVLQFPSFGLAYLLQHYCDVKADKKYQTADWRVRPLPAEMILYARMDTHYLLYIYDRLRNECVDRSSIGKPVPSCMAGVPHLLADTLNRSKMISLKTYEKDVITESAFEKFLEKFGSNLILSETQLLVMKKLYKWRDHLARLEDESTFYVLSHTSLIAIVTTLPTDVPELLNCIKPVSPIIRQYASEILAIIHDARVLVNLSNNMTSPYLQSALSLTKEPSTELDMIEKVSSTEEDHDNKLGTPRSSRQQSMSTPSTTLNQRRAREEEVNQTPATATSSLFASLSTNSPSTTLNNDKTKRNSRSLLLPSPSSSLPSPVMTTEQLYQSTKWVEQQTPSSKSAKGKKLSDPIPLSSSLDDVQEMEDDTTTTASQQAQSRKIPERIPGVPLFDFDATPMKTRAVTSASNIKVNDVLAQPQLPLFSALLDLSLPSPSHQSTSSLYSSSSSSNESYRLKAKQIHALFAHPTLYNGINIDLPSMTTPAPSDALSTPTSARTAPALNNSTESNPLTSPSATALSLAVCPSPAVGTELPKTMRDIYRLSNENRKKNKEKKKGILGTGANATGSTGSSTAGGNHESKEEDDEVGAEEDEQEDDKKKNKNKKQKSNANNASANNNNNGNNQQEFLQQIGWVSESSPNPSTHDSNTTPSSSSQEHDSKKRKFDYSNATLNTSQVKNEYFQPYVTRSGEDLTHMKNNAPKPRTMLRNRQSSMTVAKVGKK